MMLISSYCSINTNTFDDVLQAGYATHTGTVDQFEIFSIFLFKAARIYEHIIERLFI